MLCLTKLHQDEEKIIPIDDLHPGLIEVLDNALRSKQKDVGKYLKMRPQNPVTKLVSDRFCSTANLLLTFKHIIPRADADSKKHSLHWLAIKTDLPHDFQIEDYWYYEQKTGINLSVEISALIDKKFDEYEHSISSNDPDNQNVIVAILCDCIADNYKYIACIPAIDWKIYVMKKVCSDIIETILL